MVFEWALTTASSTVERRRHASGRFCKRSSPPCFNQHTHDETALPPKLREFEPLAKMASVAGALSPLKDCDAALERSPDDSAERHASVEALHKELEKAKPVLKAAITERLASPGLVQTCGEVIDVGLDFFQGSYDEIFSTIKKSEGIEAYVKPTKALTDAAARGHEKLTVVAADMRPLLPRCSARVPFPI